MTDPNKDRVADGLTEEKSWKSSALFVGEFLANLGPDFYYDFTPAQWKTWAWKAANTLNAKHHAEKEKAKKLAAHVRELRASVELLLGMLNGDPSLCEILEAEASAKESVSEAEKYLREVGEL